MKFGLYIHIPYCIQRCHYCDFATYLKSETIPTEDYITLIQKEIQWRGVHIPYKALTSIYFGGGTPSLLEPIDLKKIFQSLKQQGFTWNPNTEITIEANPATLNETKLQKYLELGINRFSVGAQSFNDTLLQACGREHLSSDTRATLDLLSKHGTNYTFDLLFALPGQRVADLDKDLDICAKYNPPTSAPIV